MAIVIKLLLLAPLVRFTLADPFNDCPAPGTVSRLEQAKGAVDEAPSPAPTVARACTSQTSNARGRYTSTLAPCTFTFHTIHEDEVRLIDYQTSDLCNDDDGFLIMEEYVFDWQDECVGDFSRCYSLKHHRQVLFDFLCAMNWKIPEETTHVSVNCMEDKSLVVEAEKHSHVAAQQERKEEKLEWVELKLFNLVLILGSCLAGIYVISKWIVKPFVAHSSLQLDPVQDQCLCESSEPPCHCNSSDQWMTPQRLSLTIDETYSEAEPIHHDFDIQIPADFDAVPIVAATILPNEE